jgi:transcriptional regulator with XRE-family HTH domain
MEITGRIAENLSAWMDESPNLDTLKKVAAKSGVGFGTVRRARNGDGNTTIKNLTAIAKAFGRSIEDLLRAPMTYATGGIVTDLPASQPKIPPLITELTAVAYTISDRGQAELIGRAKELALLHPRAKGNHANC